MPTTPISPDPLSQLLNGQPVPFVPVAPVYEHLGPLESRRMELRWRKWMDLLDQGSPPAPSTYCQMNMDCRYSYCLTSQSPCLRVDC